MKALDDFLDGLSLQEKVAQLFIENLEGDTVFVPVEKMSAMKGAGLGARNLNGEKSDAPLVPGGFLFFSYNIRNDIEGVMYFTDSIRKFCIERNIVPPFLAVDQEGGFVNRLRTLNGPLPSNERVARELDVPSAFSLYSLQARQMKALGFDMNIAPVVEVLTEENAAFLDGRSFGDAGKVLRYGRACVNAYENLNVGAVLKHFPGNTDMDPHSGLPEINLSAENLYALLESFREISRLKPAGVLMSHARTSALDPDRPACLSYAWVTEKLRNEYGFEGLVFSDDIFMKALSDNGYTPEKAVKMALDAGVDVVMISEKRFSAPASTLVEEAEKSAEFSEKIRTSARRVLVYKIRAGLLEYRRVNPFKNEYVLRVSDPYGSVEDRIVSFREARQKNIELYRDFFGR